MPLLKKKPFVFVESPSDLRPNERVWQIRFTKEIFRGYKEYLQQVNLYCQRVWKCKVTGKSHLTYEEAVISEQQARKRIQQLPKEFMEHVLCTVQFSTLGLNDLVNTIHEKLKDIFVEGEQLHGKRGNSICPCKVLKVLNSEGGGSYKLGWLDKTGNIVSTSTEDSKVLKRKKLPLAKELLRLFIKESTSLSDPWVVHDKLAMKHGISTEPPEELRENIAKRLKMSKELNDENSNKNKRRRMENGDLSMTKRRKTENELSKAKLKERQPKAVIKYPIDDLLVKPNKDDPVFSERPVPSTSFIVPVDNAGDLLMVWDFCISFGKLLRLSPFSLEQFENAIVYEGHSNLIIEAHSAILNLLIDDHGEYYSFVQEKKRKETVPLVKWAEYLCDFLELEAGPNYTAHLANIKRGDYHMLGVNSKLEILGALVHWSLSTDVIRQQLDKYIEEQQALEATKREEDLEEKRRKREEKQLKEEMKSNSNKNLKENGTSENLQTSDYVHSHGKTKDVARDVRVEAHASNGTQDLGNRGSEYGVLASRRAIMKQNLEAKVAIEREKEAVRMAELKRQREVQKARIKEAREKKEKHQRQEYFDREMEKWSVRTDPLGKDSNHNRYWFFHQEGRVFVESADGVRWGFYSSREEIDGLLGSLNLKGERELALQKKLQKHYMKICAALQKRSKEISKRGDSDTAILRRSVRVSVRPKERKLSPFLEYVNKWRR